MSELVFRLFHEAAALSAIMGAVAGRPQRAAETASGLALDSAAMVIAHFSAQLTTDIQDRPWPLLRPMKQPFPR